MIVDAINTKVRESVLGDMDKYELWVPHSYGTVEVDGHHFAPEATPAAPAAAADAASEAAASAARQAAEEEARLEAEAAAAAEDVSSGTLELPHAT